MEVFLRDASWFRRPRDRGSDYAPVDFTPKYHFAKVGNEALSACGLTPLAEFTAEDAHNVPERRRCMRPGCRKRWSVLW